MVPPRADAEAAWAALEKARQIGAKTQRERDWIEALSAYYRDHDKIPVNDRLAAYNKAMEQLTTLPRGLRGAGLLCTDLAGVGVTG